jgi:transcriptional regulator with XRE-family HTH domain
MDHLPSLPRVTLKQLRAACGLTHAEVADDTKMHRPNVVRLERPGALETMRVKTLHAYLAALGYSLSLVAAHDGKAKRGERVVEVVDPSAVEGEKPARNRRKKR